jgi:hypothetical protein
MLIRTEPFQPVVRKLLQYQSVSVAGHHENEHSELNVNYFEMFKVLLRLCYPYCGTDSDTKLLPTACQLPQFIKQHKVIVFTRGQSKHTVITITLCSYCGLMGQDTMSFDSGRNASQMLLRYETRIRKIFPAPSLCCTTDGGPTTDANLEAKRVLHACCHAK